ncbi:Sentrin-specific protease 7 [Liparis tanakae]|uniref:Sentrin-specific protease 7 n=1 Tax=Liparis tanakae TaxID=230148 RepID=A0A4Z2GPE9_9TELE|nr:Sentrin-specific protease 7 [Liparis tanakae]
MEMSSIPSIDYSFTTLHCGGHHGRANGDIMIADQQIIIPLTDAAKEVEVVLILDRKDLKRYSVWEQQELEDRELHFEDDEDPYPVAILLFCVSESAAAAVQRELLKLSVKQGGNASSDKGSPFILLTLRHPVEGMEGALLRSLLDIDCLNSLSREKFVLDLEDELEDFHSPVLSLDDSVKLIRRTGLDSHLLSLLGLETGDSNANDSERGGSHCDTDDNATPGIQPEGESQKESEPERDAATRLEPEEGQKEKELQHRPQVKKVEPAPVYTMCHRRSKGSYSVSLCKPHTSMTKFRHHGLARRQMWLIQFPPPPLKGGITVTMEDLRCLDTGHFLNDVIIDFYLKYLLLNAPAAVAERTHVFSSFFYKQLTRRDNASEGGASDSRAAPQESGQRQRRHHRVKTWTRHVDIFKKDFLFVPVNQEAHWYLVVICFPGLDEPTSEPWSGPDGRLLDPEAARGAESPKDAAETPPPPTPVHGDHVNTETGRCDPKANAVEGRLVLRSCRTVEDLFTLWFLCSSWVLVFLEKPQGDPTKEPMPGPVNCTEQTFQKRSVSKRTPWCTLTSLYTSNDGFRGSRCGGNETKSEIWYLTSTEIKPAARTDKTDEAALTISASRIPVAGGTFRRERKGFPRH